MKRYFALAILVLALSCSNAQAWYGYRTFVRSSPAGMCIRHEWRTPYGYWWVVRCYPNYRYRR